MSPAVLLDDRLLIEELLLGLDGRPAVTYTTTYWYYRAARAATVGASGHLAGPFSELGHAEQARAVARLLDLPDEIGLPDARPTVPAMVDMASRHPRLNLMNLEAAAVGRLLGAEVWLSAESAAGVLPPALEAEGVAWRVVDLV